MRCKNCRKTVENKNLLRCPHCGKPLPKKKQIDKKQVALTAGFIFVALCFVVFSFFGFFFKCSYYSSSVMIVGIIIFAICIPFLIGDFSGIQKRHTELFAIIISLPFIANWFATFISNSETIDLGGFCSVYYWLVFALVLICDIMLFVSFVKNIENTKKQAIFALCSTAVIFVITLVYFITSNVVQPIGVVIILFQNILPTFMAYYCQIQDK